MEYSIVGEGASSRLCVRDGIEASGLYWEPLPWYVPPTGSMTSCDPRLLLRVSLQREISILSSLTTPKHYTNAVAPISLAPMTLPSLSLTYRCLDFGGLPGVWPHGVRGGHARASIVPGT